MKEMLYSWQEKCLKKWFEKGGRGIVQAVTGSGKTRLALEAAARLEEKTGKDIQVKIVVPTTSLMYQWNRALRETVKNQSEGNRQIGMRGGGRKTQENCKYLIFVINSARYELARDILSDLQNGKAVFLIADECHHYASGENQLIFEFLPYMKPFEKQFFSMGLTATLPSGDAGNVLTQALGKCICRYEIKKALESKTVCKYDVFHIELPLTEDERSEYEELTDRIRALYGKITNRRPELRNRSRKDFYEALCIMAKNGNSGDTKDAVLYMKLLFRRKEVVCQAEARTYCAVSLIRMLGIRQKMIVFGERIGQADDLYEILKKYYPGRVGRYHSGMGGQANKNALERFRHGEYRILLACKSMDEGIDVPDASVGIILSGTGTQRQRIQRLGRIIRNARGKDRAALYYLHTAETSEDACFLPNEGVAEIFELKYRMETGSFSNESYDRAAEDVLEQMCAKGAPADVRREITRCLYLGSVKADWKQDREEIEKQIERAKDIRGKNYWICMKKMHIYKK